MEVDFQNLSTVQYYSRRYLHKTNKKTVDEAREPEQHAASKCVHKAQEYSDIYLPVSLTIFPRILTSVEA